MVLYIKYFLYLFFKGLVGFCAQKALLKGNKYGKIGLVNGQIPYNQAVSIVPQIGKVLLNLLFIRHMIMNVMILTESQSSLH